MKRAVLYLRVSTIEQTTANQERELREIASRMGCEIVDVYKDHGISGAKGREKRPAFDRLCRDAAKRKFDMVMAWSVDRLGRSLQDLVGFLSELHALRIDLFLHQQGLDTTTPRDRIAFGLRDERRAADVGRRGRTGGSLRTRADSPSACRPRGAARLRLHHAIFSSERVYGIVRTDEAVLVAPCAIKIQRASRWSMWARAFEIAVCAVCTMKTWTNLSSRLRNDTLAFMALRSSLAVIRCASPAPCT
jgi:hypothetical protein